MHKYVADRWMFGLLSMAILGWLAFGLVWQRGLYLDDYVWYEDIRSHTAGELPLINVEPMLSPARALVPITIGTAFQVLSKSEFAFRIIAGLWVLTNGALAGWFAWRVTARALVGGVTAAIFGLPFVAAEAVLWTGAFPYVVATTLALGTVHAIWTALTDNRRWMAWAIASALLCGMTLVFFEAFVFLAGLAILLIPLAVTKNRGVSLGRIALRAFAMSALCAGAILAFFALYYLGSPVLESRGGLMTDPGLLLTRIGGWFSRFNWMVLSPSYGRVVFADALNLGISFVAKQSMVAIAIAIALVLALAWLSHVLDGDEPVPEARAHLFWVMAVGIAWFVLGMSIPGVFASGQILEFRLLYFPYAGLALTFAAGVDLLIQIAPRHFKFAIGVLPILWITGSALTLLGFAQGFAFRYSLDQTQIAKVVPLLAQARLPDNAVVVPAMTDETIPAMGSSLASTYVGVFETPWSANAAVLLANDQASYEFVTGNRWVPLSVMCLNDDQVRVGTRVFASDQVVLFSLEPDLIVYSSLQGTGESVTCTEDLPLSKALETVSPEAIPTMPLIIASP